MDMESPEPSKSENRLVDVKLEEAGKFEPLEASKLPAEARLNGKNNWTWEVEGKTIWIPQECSIGGGILNVPGCQPKECTECKLPPKQNTDWSMAMLAGAAVLGTAGLALAPTVMEWLTKSNIQQ